MHAIPALRARGAWLNSIPGNGLVASHTLLAELTELDTSTGTRSSPSWASPPSIAPAAPSAGATPRGAAALAASRANPACAPYYQRFVAAGKPKLVALTACMRKLLVLCNALCKQQTSWVTPTAATM